MTPHGSSTPSPWQPDVLGDGYEAQTLPLLPDADGPAVATLVRFTPPQPSSVHFAALWLHGWNDYFHQKELAERISDAGGAFYGLDLRRYGRSLSPGQLAGYVSDLRAYDDDLRAAIRVITEEHGADIPLVLMAHSTGGLTAALFANRNPGVLSGLVLDSPWLELQTAWLLRMASTQAADTLARLSPTAPIPLPDSGHYTRILAGWDEELDGPRPEGTEGDPFYDGWPINPEWRTNPSMPVRPGWLTAIRQGQAQVTEGLAIDCPILVLSSTRSIIQTKWADEMRTADTVLDVNQIAEQSLKLGNHMTLVRIENAIHDVFISARPVRERAYQEVERWLGAYLQGAATA